MRVLLLLPLGCGLAALTTGCSDKGTSAPTTSSGGAASSGTGGGASIGSGGKSSGAGGGAASGGAKASGGSSAGGSSAGGSANTAAGGMSAVGGSVGNLGGTGGSAPANAMTFFVTSDTAATGNLGGLAAADQRCQTLAAAVGRGGATWRAYLSTENPAVNAIDRISNGPYINSKGVTVAADKAALHARAGDAELFLDENGMKINGQWQGSPDPNQHDIMTGSNADGSVKAGATCGDWTSAEGNVSVGHSDGLGPNMNPAPPYSSWNGAHNGDCSDPKPSGGAGRIYCFVGAP
ncbi:MAG: hypothetical protein SFV15_21985 [Polyangiaceae bacterium]|nr:hypothetical protein [Polyangiaceae bacterium]